MARAPRAYEMGADVYHLNLPERVPRAVLALCAVAALVFLFLEGMTSPYNHDEDHYLAGAVMARDHAVYQDFTYSAMPLHPVLMGMFLNAFPVEQPFWWFRALSAGIVWLGGVVLFLTLRAIVRNETLAILFSTFFVFNTLMLYSTNGVISCHIPALTLAIAGAGALHQGLTKRSAGWAALSGALLCAAAGFKLYCLLLLPPGILVCLWYRSDASEAPRQRLRLGAAFVLGTLPTGLPVLYIFLQDPYAFLFNNYIYHQYSTAWRIATGSTDRVFFFRRVMFVVEKLAFTGNGAVALIILAAAVGFGRARLWALLTRRDSMPLVWLALAAVATLGCLLPRPINLHYIMFPMPFYLLLAASLYSHADGRLRDRLRLLLAACGVIVLVSGGRYLFQEGVRGLAPEHWVPNAIHRDAGQIAEALAAYPEPRQVTTLSPLHVIEAGLPFEPAFAGSVFFYRLGEFVPVEVQARLGLVQEGHAGALLEATMPAGVLVGFEGDHEGEFLAFVAEHGYTAWEQPIHGKGTLYLRPR